MLQDAGVVAEDLDMVEVDPRQLRRTGGQRGGAECRAQTPVMLASGALVALPVAALTGGLPHAPTHVAPVVALGALTLAGTLLPFWLFAIGQARVPAELAGAFVNLEPVVGATAGWIAFGDAAAVAQLAGAAAVLLGIVLSTIPARRPCRGCEA